MSFVAGNDRVHSEEGLEMLQSRISLLDYFTEAVEYPKSHQFISRPTLLLRDSFDVLFGTIGTYNIQRLQGELIGFVPFCIYTDVYTLGPSRHHHHQVIFLFHLFAR